jgi:ABC-type Fe3+-siderophore transport system permease subunit
MDLIDLIPVVAIVGGICVAITSILSRTRLRELRIRERIAMIEKGLVPLPEVDPAGFDRAMRGGWHARRPTGRHRRAGITLMGVGFGLMVLIGFSGEAAGQAIGVGGFLVILGLAFLINGLFESKDDESMPVQPGPVPRTPPE